MFKYSSQVEGIIMYKTSLEKKIAALEAASKARDNKRHKQNEAEEERSLRKNSSTKSISLARAYYRFSLTEKRVMEAVISKINPQSASKPQAIKLTAAEYAEAFSAHPKTAYRDLEFAAKSLIRKVIAVRQSDTKYTEISIAHLVEYDSEDVGEGSVTITLSEKIVPHLINLQGKLHVKFGMEKAVDFKSSYTWRFFEVLLSQRKRGKTVYGNWEYKVDELRKLLAIPDSYVWANIRRTLEKSCEEISLFANISVEMKFKKTARKITSIEFFFLENSQQKLI